MYRTLKQNKYGAIKQNGFHSRKESGYAWELQVRKKAGEIKDFETQRKIELFGENGTRVCNYFIDFVITHNDGTEEFVEVKGFETPVWRLKWKLFEDKYGKDASKKLTIIK